MIDKAKLVTRHLPNILAYFTHRITNAEQKDGTRKLQLYKSAPAGSATRTTSRSPFISTAALLIFIRLQASTQKPEEPLI
jgi:hypothetical protein